MPGDKSISHRAVLLGAVSSAPVTVAGFLRSADTMATVGAVRALGVEVQELGGDLVVHGQGWEGLREPEDVIDVANSRHAHPLACPALWPPATSCAFSRVMPASADVPWAECCSRCRSWGPR